MIPNLFQRPYLFAQFIYFYMLCYAKKNLKAILLFTVIILILSVDINFEVEVNFIFFFDNF